MISIECDCGCNGCVTVSNPEALRDSNHPNWATAILLLQDWHNRNKPMTVIEVNQR